MVELGGEMRFLTTFYRISPACVIAATLFCPMAAAGEEIRVLFVPSQDLATEVQTKALARAVAQTSRSVRVVNDLTDADVLLQFTEYRVEQRKTDGPWRWWEGRVKVLLPADAGVKDVALALRLPERFALVIMGQDAGSEMERTVAALENYLRKALRREIAKPGREVI
jgi:hypothetical protein